VAYLVEQERGLKMISKKNSGVGLLVAVSFAAASLTMTMPVDAKAAEGSHSKAASHPNSKTQSATQNKDTAICAQINTLTKTLASGNASSVSALWTENGTYIDEDGNVFKGRSALEKRFSTVFKESGKQQFELTPETIRFLSDKVAISEGTVLSKEGTKSKPETRFTLVFQNQDGTWLISQATETPITPIESTQSTEALLKDLDWLIGSWKAERNGSSVRMTAEWAANKRFIHCTYEIQRPGEPLQKDIQIIGYDPTKEELVSWHFDSTGGFGYGSWYKRDNQWMVESTGVESDGSTSKAINIIQSVDPNAFSWQSVNRSVDGVAFADTNELKVQRVTQ
jgi:uncharacterized protein (TIGR02246 family)